VAELLGEAEVLRRTLAERFPGQTEYDLALAQKCYSFGQQLQGQGKDAETAEWFGKGIALLQPLHAKDPRDGTVRVYLRYSYAGRARAYSRLNRHADALKDWDQAIALSPAEERSRYLATRANDRALSGMVTEAIAEIAELTRSDTKWDADQWYDFACVYAVASGKILEKRKEYAGRAMELLTRATAAGFNDPAHAAKDTDLDPLRDRDDFKKWLASMPGPKVAPKAKAREVAPRG
jgi:tetratricopeptide (TPR) repeat protein